jgi:hypothetical protein
MLRAAWEPTFLASPQASGQQVAAGWPSVAAASGDLVKAGQEESWGKTEGDTV